MVVKARACRTNVTPASGKRWFELKGRSTVNAKLWDNEGDLLVSSLVPQRWRGTLTRNFPHVFAWLKHTHFAFRAPNALCCAIFTKSVGFFSFLNANQPQHDCCLAQCESLSLQSAQVVLRLIDRWTKHAGLQVCHFLCFVALSDWNIIVAILIWLAVILVNDWNGICGAVKV